MLLGSPIHLFHELRGFGGQLFFAFPDARSVPQATREIFFIPATEEFTTESSK